VDRNLEVHTSLLHYCTFGLGAANDAQDVMADTARGKDNDQQNNIQQEAQLMLTNHVVTLKSGSEVTQCY